MWDEIKLLKNVLLRSILVFVTFALVFFAIPFALIDVRGVPIPVPQQSSTDAGSTFSGFAIEHIRATLVPEGVTLVTASPLDPFTIKATVAVLAAFAIAFPYFVFETWRYFRSGLYRQERKVIALLCISSIILFSAGAIFAYLLLIPLIFNALFSYLPLDIIPYYSVKELISLVAGLMFACGILFTLPVMMVLITRFAFVPAQFWLTYARQAILITLVVSAIITPDGSGISMVLLSVPICALYSVGYAGSAVAERARVRKKSYTF